MTGTVVNASNALQAILSGDTGLVWALSQGAPSLADQVFPVCEIRNEHVASDIADRSPIRYPFVTIYCERLSNTQREKFTTFSGSAQFVIEVRASANSLSSTRAQTLAYTEAIMTVLDCHKGEWAPGVQYCGGYETQYQQIKRGGEQLLQVTRIIVPLQIHKR